MRASTEKPVSFRSSNSLDESVKDCIKERHKLVALCALCLGISYCDRVNLSVAIIPMSEELGYDINEKARILSSFFYGYIFSQILGAILARQFGGHVVLGIAGFLWSLATFIVPFLSYSVPVLSACRMLLGLAEGVSFPVVYQLLSLNIPEDERSRCMACLSAGVFSGALISFILSPLIVTYFGWRMVFYFFGSIGFIWVFMWNRWWAQATEMISHFSRENRVDNPKDFLILVVSELREFIVLFSVMVKSPLLRSIFWCHFCHNIGHYVLLAWLPSYFDEELGLHGNSLVLTCVPYFVMTMVVIAVSRYADSKIVAGTDILKIRRFSTISGFAGAAIFMLLLTTTRDQYLSILFLCLALSTNGAGPVAGYEAAKLDITHADQAGRVQATSNTFATLAGIIGIPFVAFISRTTGSWNVVFLTISCIFASAAYVFWKYGKWKGKLRIDVS